MKARERPFPLSGLPPDATQIFQAVCDLAYKDQHLVERYSVEGQLGHTMVRKLGAFELRIDFETSRAEDLMRYTAMIFYEERLVFNAWCSKIGRTGVTIGQVVTFTDGPWRAHLRRRAESRPKR